MESKQRQKRAKEPNDQPKSKKPRLAKESPQVLRDQSNSVEVLFSGDANKKRSSDHYDYLNGSFKQSFFDRKKRLSLVSQEIGQESNLSSTFPSLLVLPDELLLQILGLLSQACLVRCGLTCSRLARLAFSPKFWKCVHVTAHSVNLRHFLSALNQRNVMALKACGVYFELDEEHRVPQGEGLVKLGHLDLTMSNLSVSALSWLLQGCENLVNVVLEGIRVSPQVCSRLAQNSHLTVLNLGSAKNLDSHGIGLIVDSCRELVQLNLAWSYLSSQALTYLCGNLSSRIRRLNLSGHRETMDDSHVRLLVNQCQEIEELNLDDCNLLTSGAVETLSLLERLTVLNMSRCFNVLPAKYMMLTNLRELNVFGSVKEDTKEAILERRPGLKVNVTIASKIARPKYGVPRKSNSASR